jgi:hypothetical protein
MIDTQVMKQFLALANSRLTGDWVIIGGILLPLLGINHRVTVDIDIINLDFKNSVDQTIELMDIAQALNLPVETINQAGSYYFSKMTDARDNLILLQESEKFKQTMLDLVSEKKNGKQAEARERILKLESAITQIK